MHLLTSALNKADDPAISCFSTNGFSSQIGKHCFCIPGEEEDDNPCSFSNLSRFFLPFVFLLILARPNLCNISATKWSHWKTLWTLSLNLSLSSLNIFPRNKVTTPNGPDQCFLFVCGCLTRLKKAHNLVFQSCVLEGGRNPMRGLLTFCAGFVLIVEFKQCQCIIPSCAAPTDWQRSATHENSDRVNWAGAMRSSDIKLAENLIRLHSDMNIRVRLSPLTCTL